MGWGCTDPTYKEWKLCICLPVMPDWIILHGSYLQGMETKSTPTPALTSSAARILPTRNGNGALWIPKIVGLYFSTDPTYKEWKLHGDVIQRHVTMDGHGSYLQGMETVGLLKNDDFRLVCTDPTYKEWKHGEL